MSRATKYQLSAGLLIVGLGSLFVVAGTRWGSLEASATILLVGGVTIANLLVMGWFVRLWLRPVKQLSREMNEVLQGGGISEAAFEREDEIGDLARHFNTIVGGLRTAQENSVEIGRKQASIEKFAALGRLSAGVAHEINNPVGGILTCLESMRSLEPGSERYVEYLSLVRSGLERIGTIVKQLLSFSRQGASERRDVDANGVIREVTVLSAFHKRKKEVEVIHEAGELPAVHGSPDLLNQLFLNLVLNALQAMPDGGTLRIRTWAENGEVLASFEDTGPGISEENLERIFEPFFTTKEVGVGTGLGLSVALGIVEAHGGEIHVENRVEGGARFIVRLPSAVRGVWVGDRREVDR